MRTLVGFLLASGFALFNSIGYAMDDDAAKALLKEHNCVKCHAPEKEKLGPSLKQIATKRAGQGDAEAILVKAMQSTDNVKLTDGTEGAHKALDIKDPAILRDVARWILNR